MSGVLVHYTFERTSLMVTKQRRTTSMKHRVADKMNKYCLPLLTYCIGAIDLPASSVKDLAVCWNYCFFFKFGYKQYESVKELQFFCGELPFEYITRNF